MILCETRHHAQTHFKFCALEHSTLALAGHKLGIWGSGVCWSWLASICWCGFPVSQPLLKSHSAFQPSWLWDDLDFLQLLGSKVLTRKSLKYWCVYFAAHKDNSPVVEYCLIQKVEKQFLGTLEDTLTH
jgi:hypothetical protein